MKTLLFILNLVAISAWLWTFRSTYLSFKWIQKIRGLSKKKRKFIITLIIPLGIIICMYLSLHLYWLFTEYKSTHPCINISLSIFHISVALLLSKLISYSTENFKN